MADKVCQICEIEFYTKTSTKWCSLDCKKAGRRLYAQRYYHRPYVTEGLKIRNKRYRDNAPELQLLSGARWRSSKRGEITNLTKEDIVIPEYCPVLKVPLARSGRFGPTLDRKDSTMGYLKENVWVVCRLANQMKSDANLDELKRFAEWIKTLQPYQTTSTIF